MYPYHNRNKQRIKNGELTGFEFVEDWPKIGSCLLLRFSTLPALRPIRPKRFAEYAPILKAWAEKNFSSQTNEAMPTGKKLAEVKPGETFKIGEHEFMVLEHGDSGTAAIRKELLKNMAFGKNNDFACSNIQEVCEEFAEEISEIIGKDNVIPHDVDLTSDDGLKDYGTVQCRASLLTADRYRKYVYILDKHRPDKWWWLATPYSTKNHANDSWIKCVAPSGYFGNGNCNNGGRGVRPFCIFNSNIFVS